jgi:hypothetical protein
MFSKCNRVTDAGVHRMTGGITPIRTVVDTVNTRVSNPMDTGIVSWRNHVVFFYQSNKKGTKFLRLMTVESSALVKAREGAVKIELTRNAVLRALQSDLAQTKATVADLVDLITGIVDANTRARTDTMRWIGSLDQRLDRLKGELYTKPNVPPPKNDHEFSLCFVLKTRPVVLARGLDAALLGLEAPVHGGGDRASHTALTHYALSIWVGDVLSANNIDTEWLPNLRFETSMSVDGVHTLKLKTSMGLNEKRKAMRINWENEFSSASPFVTVYLSYSLADLYDIQRCCIKT